MTQPPSDLAACRRNLAARREAARHRNLERWQRARADADRIVRHIAGTYHPDRIIEWGSLLAPERFGPRSDIDIAVDGPFTAETWFRLLGEAWQMSAFSLDIVDLRHIEPEFADIIRMKGTVVYERRPDPH